MARLIAAALLVCAAFAWVPPFLDRPGTAALGFAFLALATGRRVPSVRRYMPRVAPPEALAHPERIEPMSTELAELIGDLEHVSGKGVTAGR